MTVQDPSTPLDALFPQDEPKQAPQEPSAPEASVPEPLSGTPLDRLFGEPEPQEEADFTPLGRLLAGKDVSQIGFAEAATTTEFGVQKGVGDWIPYIATGISGIKWVDMFDAGEAFNSGTASKRQLGMLGDYLDYHLRDKGFGGRVGDIAGELPTFALEFAGGLSIAKVIGKKAMTTAGGMALEKALQKMAKSKIGGALEKQVVTRTAGKLIAAGAAGVGVALVNELPRAPWGRVMANARRVQFQRRFGIGADEAGDLVLDILGDPQSLVDVLPVAIMDELIEYGSEMTGAAIPFVTKLDALTDDMLAFFFSKKGMKAGREFLKKHGIGGVHAEVGEEYLGAAAREAIGAAGDVQEFKGALPDTFGQTLEMYVAFGLRGGVGTAKGLLGEGVQGRRREAGEKELRETLTKRLKDEAEEAGVERSDEVIERMVDEKIRQAREAVESLMDEEEDQDLSEEELVDLEAMTPEDAEKWLREHGFLPVEEEGVSERGLTEEEEEFFKEDEVEETTAQRIAREYEEKRRKSTPEERAAIPDEGEKVWLSLPGGLMEWTYEGWDEDSGSHKFSKPITDPNTNEPTGVNSNTSIDRPHLAESVFKTKAEALAWEKAERERKKKEAQDAAEYEKEQKAKKEFTEEEQDAIDSFLGTEQEEQVEGREEPVGNDELPPSAKQPSAEATDAPLPTPGGVEPQAPEGLAEGALVDTQGLGGADHGKPLAEESYRALDAPSQREVKARVLAATHDLKVREAIVAALPVSVVDNLGGPEAATQRLLDDPSVLEALLSPDADNPITAGIDVADALVRGAARAIAEVGAAASDARGSALEGGPAVGTVDSGQGVTSIDVEPGAEEGESSSRPPTITPEEEAYQAGVAELETGVDELPPRPVPPGSTDAMILYGDDSVVADAAQLELPGGQSIDVVYTIAEADWLTPSHDPTAGFKKNPGGDINERPYEDPTEGKEIRAMVEKIADPKRSKPAQLVTDDPTPTGGPPVVTSAGVVLGGNARSMGLQLAYSRGNKAADQYREALRRAMSRFGFDADTLDSFQHPVLVREIAAGQEGAPGELSRILNQGSVAPRTATADAVSRGSKVDASVAELVAALMGDGSLAEVWAGGNADRLVGALVTSGAFDEADLAQFMVGGKLTKSGKDTIEQLLLASVVPDVRAIASLAPGTRNKLIRSLPGLIRLKLKWPEFTEHMIDAVDAIASMRESKLKVEQALVQTTLEKELWKFNPVAVAMAGALKGEGPLNLAGMFRELADQVEGKRGLFDEAQTDEPVEATLGVFKQYVVEIPGDGPTLTGMPAPGHRVARNRRRKPPKPDVLGSPAHEGTEDFERMVASMSPEVKDAEGRPIVVYHGTGAVLGQRMVSFYKKQIAQYGRQLRDYIAEGLPQVDIDVLTRIVAENKEKLAQAQEKALDPDLYGSTDGGYFSAGTYLSASPKEASDYAQLSGVSGAPNVLPVYPVFRNPYIAKSDPGIEGLISKAQIEARELEMQRGASSLDTSTRAVQARARRDVLVAHGFDSEIVRGGTGSEGADEYIAFESHQMKSATGNKGTYSPDSPSLMDSPAQTAAPAKRKPRKRSTKTEPVVTTDFDALDPEDMRMQRTRGVLRRFGFRGLDDPESIEENLYGAAQAVRGRGEVELQGRDNLYSIINDLARRFGAGKPGVGKAKRLRNWSLGFYDPSTEGIRLRKASGVRTYFHELGHHLHRVMFPRRGRASKGAALGTAKGYQLKREDFPKQWRAPLVRLGKALYGTSKPASGYTTEGWAEVVRYLIADPAALRAQEPGLYREVVTMLSHDHVESWLVLKEARQRFRAFLVGSAQNPVAGYVQRGKIAKVATPAGDRRRMDWTDRWARARTMLRDLGFDGTGKLPMHEDPYFMLRRLENATSGDFKALMETGRWDVDDPGKRVTGPGIMEIHDPVRDVLPLYEDYGIAKRQLEKHAQARQFERDNPGKKGYDVLLAEGDEAQAVADLEKFIADTELSHPEIPEVWREFQEFNQWMIGEYAVHHGLLTPEAAKKIIAANQEYITFRYATDDKVLRKLSGKTGQSVNLGSGVKFFKGTLGEPLLPPIPAYLATMHGIIDRAQKTRAARALLTLADFDGNDPERAEKTARWVQRIENPIKGVNIKGGELSEEVMKKLGIWRDAGNNLHVPGELAGMEEEDLEGLVELIQGFDDATFWKPSNDIDEDRQVVRILVEGKFQYYQIMDDSGLLWEMFKGVYAAQKVEGLLGILRWPAMALRAGATQNNISFGLTNVIRDVWYALTLTTTDLKRRDQAMNRLRGVKEAFLGGEWADLYQASGADMEGIFGNEYWNRKKKQFDLSNTFEEHGILTDQSRRALLNDKNLLKAVWEGRVIRNVRKGKPGRAALELTMLPLFGRINSRLERMTRIGEFIQRYKEAKEGGVTSEAEAIAIAAHAAANVTLDWSKGGRISKSVNQYVPFFNAALLGPARIVEHFQGAAKRGPKAVAKAFAGVTTMMVFPSILTFLLTWDDDDYWNIDQRKRDRNWYFPTGRTDAGARTYLRLPKPYGLAAWSILVERSLANLFGINPQTGEFTGDPEAFNWGLLSSVYTELAPTLSVAGAQPLIEVIFTEQGYDFYWENEIVPMRDKDLPVGMQGAERSSNFSRMMGEALGYPPAKIDHLIYGFFAGAGKNVMRDYVDPVVGLVVPSSKDLGRPKDKSEQAFLGAIVRRFREEAGRGRTEAIERFYEDWKDVDAAKRGHNRLVQLWGSGDERVRAFEIKNAYDLERYKQMGHTNRRLSKLWSRLRSSYRDIPDPDALELAIVSIQRDILEEARRPYR